MVLEWFECWTCKNRKTGTYCILATLNTAHQTGWIGFWHRCFVKTTRNYLKLWKIFKQIEMPKICDSIVLMYTCIGIVVRWRSWLWRTVCTLAGLCWGESVGEASEQELETSERMALVWAPLLGSGLTSQLTAHQFSLLPALKKSSASRGRLFLAPQPISLLNAFSHSPAHPASLAPIEIKTNA